MHQKHPKLARPALGNYARTEFAFVGSTCERMEAIMSDWAGHLSCRTLLVTGEHVEHEAAGDLRFGSKRFTPSRAPWNDFDDRLLGSDYDLALVNGNHYPAARQIVFVDEKKAGTLVRRRDQLSDVFAVVQVSQGNQLPDWLAELCNAQADAPRIVEIGEVDTLLPLIEEELAGAVPELNALILTGGKSSRMGRDKSGIVYRGGQTEAQRLRGLCQNVGLSVWQGVGDRQQAEGEKEIVDRFVGLGPVGAICSAFMARPDVAWLVLACDLPLLDEATLRQLIDARCPQRVATAVRAPDKPWPEPLVAIYEPRAYQRLLQFLALGYACPRKLLINSDTEVVVLPDGRPVTNANTPEERRQVLNHLQSSAVTK